MLLELHHGEHGIEKYQYYHNLKQPKISLHGLPGFFPDDSTFKRTKRYMF